MEFKHGYVEFIDPDAYVDMRLQKDAPFGWTPVNPSERLRGATVVRANAFLTFEVYNASSSVIAVPDKLTSVVFSPSRTTSCLRSRPGLRLRLRRGG